MAGRKRKGTSVQGGALFSDGKPCTDPAKEAAKEHKLAREVAQKRDLREERIEHIAAVMRAFCDSKGNVLWTRKLAISLSKSWGMTHQQVLKLSDEAHRRVKEEVDDPDTIRRNVGAVMQAGLAHSQAKKDYKTAAVVAGVMIKMADGPVKVEVTVESKQPTPADGAQAVKDFFGVRVTNAEVETGSIAAPGGVERADNPEPSDSPTDGTTKE